MFTRTFNQDPLENFFSSIRSYGIKNINPTCSSFLASYKSLLVNNFVSYHSDGANCEDDISDGPLNSLKSFLIKTPFSEEERPANTPIFYSSKFRMTYKILRQYYAILYVAGCIIQKLFATISSCDNCKQILYSTNSGTNIFIQSNSSTVTADEYIRLKHFLWCFITALRQLLITYFISLLTLI